MSFEQNTTKYKPTNTTTRSTSLSTKTNKIIDDPFRWSSSKQKISEYWKKTEKKNQHRYSGIGMVDDPSCSCGADTEDVDHVLWHCVKYAAQRSHMIEKLKSRGYRHPSVTDNFMKATDHYSRAISHKFLTECNLTIQNCTRLCCVVILSRHNRQCK